MSTLDAVIQEIVKRLEASGGKAWISQDAPEELKLAFLEALLNHQGNVNDEKLRILDIKIKNPALIGRESKNWGCLNF